MCTWGSLDYQRKSKRPGKTTRCVGYGGEQLWYHSSELVFIIYNISDCVYFATAKHEQVFPMHVYADRPTSWPNLANLLHLVCSVATQPSTCLSDGLGTQLRTVYFEK